MIGGLQKWYECFLIFLDFSGFSLNYWRLMHLILVKVDKCIFYLVGSFMVKFKLSLISPTK